MTRLFLASWLSRVKALRKVNPPYILESYYYIDELSEKSKKFFMDYVESDKCKMFLLDSGAFTYMEKVKTSKEIPLEKIDSYVDNYIKFINEYDIKYFFEMDIDVVVGLEKVEEYRKRIEEGTGKKTIPVFHRERGKDYFIKMCKEYDYVAIGGLAVKDVKINEYKYLKWFIDTAHKYKTKIHGLGFTSIEGLKRYNFDTVDSTSWISGGRFGRMVRYNPITHKIEEIKKPENKRIKSKVRIKMDEISGREWVKFGNFLERHNKSKVLRWSDE